MATSGWSKKVARIGVVVALVFATVASTWSPVTPPKQVTPDAVVWCRMPC